jgi:predicted DNA-binding transcriptional regulator YafY
MIKTTVLDGRREGKEVFNQFDMAIYAKKTFGMFGGKEQTVKLECENEMAGVIIDRFGKDVSLIKLDDEHFTVNVNVAMSKQFMAWVFALGEGVRIVAPDSVVEQMRCEIERLMNQYEVTK